MKVLAKSVLSSVYKYSGAVAVQEMLARRAGKSCLAILLFHRVTDAVPEDGLTVSTQTFAGMCRMLKRSFRVVPLAEIFRLVRSGEPWPRRTVGITFDDGYRDNLFAARTLAEHGLPACFFVTTSYLGTERIFEWDRGLKSMPILTWDDVRAMHKLGFEIGSHTVTHPNLSAVSLDCVRRELRESKTVIEEQIQNPVRWLAYPFGGQADFPPDRLPLVEETGYEGCVSAYGGFIHPDVDRRLLPRQPVPYFRSVANLELHLTGCLEWFYALKRRTGMIKGPGTNGHSHGSDCRQENAP